MKHLIFGVVIIGGILLTTMTNGQTANNDRLKYQRATQEVEFILSSADKIDNPLLMAKVKAKAANVIWTQSPEQSRAIFVKLWDYIDSQTDKSFDKEEARMAVLQYLLPKDRALANRLLKKSAGNTEEKVSDFDKINGKDPETRRLAFTSYRLAETDATLAATVLEQSLAHSTPPMVAPILTRIRERNPLLANYVASRALENFLNQPRTVALIGLNTLVAYLFPYTPSPAASPEVAESDENLRFQFMSVGYQILKESLTESDEFLIKEQQLSKQSLGFRTFSQAMLAAILTALAPRYAPQYFVALNEAANRLIATQSKQFADLIQFQVAAVKGTIGATGETERSEVSEAEISNALSKGDFKEAENLIDKLKDETKKKTWTQLLLKAQTKFHLTNGELLLALSAARKMDNAAQRMLLLAEIAKAAHKKRDQVLLTDILLEARKTSADSLPKGTHAATLFAIAAETAYFAAPEATLMLQDAVAVVNSMTYSVDDKKADSSSAAFLNDPNRFVDSTEMMRAFAALGEVNIEDTLLVAGKLENKPVQMAARLATIEKILRKTLPKVKPEVQPSLSPKSKQ